MTPINTLLSIALDASMSGTFALFAAYSWRFHEGPVRTRLVTACVIVAADTGAAVVARLLDGGAVPIWYVPIYGMTLPVVAYTVVLHLMTLRARMRVLRERVEVVCAELERREQATLARARQS